ncbi:MAG: amino acid ABC transporter permease [Saccharofermentanales bacterium]
MQSDRSNVFIRMFYSKANHQAPALVKAFNFLLVLAVLVAVMVFSFMRVGTMNQFFRLFEYAPNIARGFAYTLLLSIVSLALSLLIGSVSAASSLSRFLPFYYSGKIYTGIIRNTPLLVQIFIFYYVVATAFGLSNRYVLGALILSVFGGAYVGEIIRAGLESIPVSQSDAGRSLGFSDAQVYLYIVIPQAVKRIIPGLAGQFVSLVKDSSLLYVIAVGELTKAIQEINSLNFNIIENYVWLAVFYLAITLPLSQLSIWVERKFAFEE